MKRLSLILTIRSALSLFYLHNSTSCTFAAIKRLTFWQMYPTTRHTYFARFTNSRYGGVDGCFKGVLSSDVIASYCRQPYGNDGGTGIYLYSDGHKRRDHAQLNAQFYFSLFRRVHNTGQYKGDFYIKGAQNITFRWAY